jgi:hypothetical protein
LPFSSPATCCPQYAQPWVRCVSPLKSTFIHIDHLGRSLCREDVPKFLEIGRRLAGSRSAYPRVFVMRHLQPLEHIPNGIDSNFKVLGSFVQGGRRVLGDMLPQGQLISLPLSRPMSFRSEIGALAPILYTPETDAKPSSGFGFATARALIQPPLVANQDCRP